jgi:hypothetical protein
MISRKSNITSADQPLETPAFRVIAWMAQVDRRRLAFVTLGRDFNDLHELVQRGVILDGSKHFCHAVRTFGPGPYFKGDTVALLVAEA